MIFSPFLIAIGGFFSQDKISNPSEHEFNQKWGSFFAEFRNNRGFLSTQYYTLFLVRRLLFLASQVYLNSALFVQASLNVIFSFVQVLYLIIYTPFTNKLAFASAIGGELVTTIVMALCSVFLFNIGQDIQDIFTLIIMLIMLAGLGFQFLCSFSSTVGGIKEIWDKVVSDREKAFLRAGSMITSSRVHTIESNIVEKNKEKNI